MQARASVIITSQNRVKDLRRLLESALTQNVALEVMVIDDGSSDGTSDMVSKEFPSVRLHHELESRGYIVRRNQAARLASAPILVSIDDDAVFSSPRVVEQTLLEFNHPRIGAVAIPFVNVNTDPEVHQRAPDVDGVWVTDSYIGTAHAVRRELFLALGGYREFLFHQGEEGDFCLRMLAAGRVVRLGRAEPIHHFESPRRDFSRMDYYGKRNLLLFAWYNVPFPYLPIHLAATTARGAWHGLASGRPAKSWQGLLGGLAACTQQWSARRPVPRSVYRLARYLKKMGCVHLAEVEARLPPIQHVAADGDR